MKHPPPPRGNGSPSSYESHFSFTQSFSAHPLRYFYSSFRVPFPPSLAPFASTKRANALHLARTQSLSSLVGAVGARWWRQLARVMVWAQVGVDQTPPLNGGLGEGGFDHASPLVSAAHPSQAVGARPSRGGRISAGHLLPQFPFLSRSQRDWLVPFLSGRRREGEIR